MATINGKALVKDGKPLDRAYSNGQLIYGRNLLLNSSNLGFWYGNNAGKTTITVESFDKTTNMWHFVAPQQSFSNAGIYIANTTVKSGDSWVLSFDIKGTGIWSSIGARLEGSTVNTPVGNNTASWNRLSSTGIKTKDSGSVVLYFDLTNSPLDVYIKLPKLEIGTMPTDWTPAPEDYI
ncbi:MAG: hypothetical protein ABF477_07640 [Leuconostoc pseudomesenteroides]|uniref:hypothetical protein n=1 Tax=Leuconostoc pseudomesenteroides TaxID=33968 RepID=UPI0039E93C76